MGFFLFVCFGFFFLLAFFFQLFSFLFDLTIFISVDDNDVEGNEYNDDNIDDILMTMKMMMIIIITIVCLGIVVDIKMDIVEGKSVAECFLLKEIVRCPSCDMRLSTSWCRIKL